MTKIECRCHLTQTSGSMLLGFLTVEICHRMKMKYCNFVMLVNMGLMPLWEKAERNWNMTLESVQEDSFYFMFTMYSWRNCHFLKGVSTWVSVSLLCHVLFLLVNPSVKARKCMRVMPVGCFSSNCEQWGSCTRVLFIAITLMDYLLLQTCEKVISEREQIFLDV